MCGCLGCRIYSWSNSPFPTAVGCAKYMCAHIACMAAPSPFHTHAPDKYYFYTHKLQSAMSKVVIKMALLKRQPLYMKQPELNRRLLIGDDDLTDFTAILDRTDPGCTVMEGGSAAFRKWIVHCGPGSMKWEPALLLPALLVCIQQYCAQLSMPAS